MTGWACAIIAARPAQGVADGRDEAAGADHDAVTNADLGDIENRHVVVGEDAVTPVDVGTVVAMEGRLDGDAPAGRLSRPRAPAM